ncbi:MAG: beta-lactamase family protein, partial [Gemmatimonadota bacterium]|nr:beta-lactamase family protein [Gemmatimonadota bacterium]
PSPSTLHLDDLPRWMRLASVPGVSIAIVGRDRVTTRGFGVTRAGGADAVNADTVFEAASLSKPVFAYLVLRLAADGVIDLDRPLGEYVALPNPSDAAARPISARSVLSHTTGWRNWRIARDHVLTADFTPGSRFGYSGEGYYLLQRVVERMTGRGILRLTRERVFEPLGMRRSAYMSRPDLEVNRAEPHSNRGVPIESFNTRVSRGLREFAATTSKSMDDWAHEDAERAAPTVNKDAPVFPNFLLPNVAGSLLTTANDYALFLRHLLGLPGAPAGGRAVLDRMLAPQITINEALRWGLGFGLQSPGAGRPDQFWHWGDSGGVKAFVLGDPAAGNAIVVFTNGNAGRAVYERVVRAVRREDQPAFLWI